MSDDADEASPTDRLRYLLTLSRPRFWLYLAGPVAIGAVYGAGTPGDLLRPATIGLFLYFVLPANVLLYGVNDVFDADIDAANPKKGGGVAESLPRDARESRWRGDPVVAAAVVATGVLGLATFVVTPSVAWPYLAGFFVLGIGYSAPPLRFKTTPPLDSLSNGLYILPGAAAYAAVSGTHPPALALVGAWLWTMAMHTFSAIPDVEPDRAAGVETTATLLGERRTYGYCFACWTGAAAAFAAIDGRFLAAFVVYPAFVAWVATSDVSVDRAYWWFPALNTVVGGGLTMAGLWLLLPPAGVLT